MCAYKVFPSVDVKFMIELDRRGSNEAVFMIVVTRNFKTRSFLLDLRRAMELSQTFLFLVPSMISLL